MHAGTNPFRVVYLDHCALMSGAEIALVRLLEALGAAVEPYVILGEDGPLVQRLERAGARVDVVPMPADVATVTRMQVGRGLGIGVVARAALYSARLVPLLRRIKPDIVHTNSLKAAFYGVPAARVARLPVLWHLRDQISPDYMSPAAVKIVRAAIRTLPTAVVANSTSTLATVSGTHRGRPASNAVSLPDAVPWRASLPLQQELDQPLRIIVLGRLARWKGQDIFLDAFAAAYPRGGAVARIVGEAMFSDVGYAQELVNQAARLGISDRVKFCGFREDIWSELADNDVLVHCSRTPEPFGQVVIEGLAAGLAVIATDAGGPAEILTDGQDGLLTPPGDSPALSRAMLRLGDSGLRVQLAAAGRVTAERYSPERAAAGMLEVYRSLTLPGSR